MTAADHQDAEPANAMPRSFRLKPVAAFATALAVAILVSLGVWQLHRLEWKNDLVAKIDARVAAAPIPFEAALTRARAGEDMTYTPVTISGRFDHAREAHVYGTLDGRPGVYVFTPLAADDSVVYVNRGFAPVQLKDRDARADGLASSQVRVVGLFRAPRASSGVAALVQPPDNPARNEWHQRNPEAFAAAAALQTVPYFIDSNGAENPGDWPRGAVTRTDFNNRHFEYALTWFGLAATAIGVFIFFSFERAPRQRASAGAGGAA